MESVLSIERLGLVPGTAAGLQFKGINQCYWDRWNPPVNYRVYQQESFDCVGRMRPLGLPVGLFFLVLVWAAGHWLPSCAGLRAFGSLDIWLGFEVLSGTQLKVLRTFKQWSGRGCGYRAKNKLTP
jgi:hypothetical protein